ncbi:MAG: YezD family protein [Clostridiales Family XIII bacterium]|jgi:hypothetical protein|nr:YezD family protein [Clostridiales Family XIII bacterium]
MAELKDIIRKDTISEQDFKLLLDYIDSIEFGSVAIKIQNNKVVQIEKSEKIKIR